MAVMVDRVLDRVPSVPDRRRQVEYNLADAIVGLTPRSYTWSVRQVLDQGREGACVGHGWAHEALARPAVVKFPRPAPEATEPLSAQLFAFRLYDWCRRNDEWAGEDYDGTSVAAGARGMARAGLIPEYRWTRNVNDAATAVSRTGPAVIGVDWFSGMFEADSNGYLNLTGQVEGGHCVLMNGYSLRRRAFLIHNSWGPSWSRGGQAWIRHDDMARLLADGGEVCVPVRRSI
jgi:hypothetical protein